MQRKPLKMLGGAIATAIVALMLIGCRGSAGQTGAAGANGSNGTNGSNGNNGTNGATYTIDAATLTPDEWSGLTLKGQITSVTMGTAPVVNFKMTEGHNVPVKGLGFLGKGSADPYGVYLNMAFSVAKLVPANATTGAPSRWVSYIVTSNPTVAAPTTWNPTRPSTDNIGTLVDNGDGTYKYTFRRDISQTKAQLDAYTFTGNNLKADLDYDNLNYDATQTHRITGYVGGTAWGTGSNNATRTNTGFVGVPILNPANFLYDFVPATGAAVTSANEQREITSVDKCFTCHAKFEFHGGGRQDTRYCVVCHNDQRKYGYANATLPLDPVAGQRKFRDQAMGDFPSFIHRLHMGEELTNQGWSYAGVAYNEITYPQDHRNCVKCHTNSAATPQGDNWWKKPSRLACGGCHDKADFASATNHNHGEGGQQLTDQNCVNCHTEAYIKLDHIPIVPPNPNNIYLGGTTGTNNNTNASFIAAYNGQTANGTPTNLPAGAKKPTWEINSFTLNSSAKAVIKFRILLDGVPQVLNTYSATGKTEMLDGFVGGPSVYVAFAVPYDGITYPADWNATFSTYLKNSWRGDGKDMTGAALAASAKTTLTGPDAASTAWYTITFTDAVIPPTASMITAGIGFTYGLTATQPLTQITGVTGFPWLPNFYAYNVEGKKQGGLSVPAPNVIKALSGTLPAGFPISDATKNPPVGPANDTRRVIVSTQKCNDCHGALGVFTAKTYHAGQRNDAPTCEFCHNGQRVNSGWGVNTKDFVHALHGAGKRVNKFSWESGAGNKYWTITYPSVLNNCEACHLPGTYDFKIAANANEVPNLNWTTVATGTVPNPVPVIITGNEPVSSGGVTYWSPFVTAGAAYGSGFSFSANTGAITPAAGTTLVNSPYVAACSNCHDTDMALNHMKANGGSFYVPRSSVQNPSTGALINKEQCFLCHSSGKIADVQMVHMNFK